MELTFSPLRNSGKILISWKYRGDFPAWGVEALDREAARINVTRQSISKVWLGERLKAEAADKPVNGDAAGGCILAERFSNLRGQPTGQEQPFAHFRSSAKCATGRMEMILPLGRLNPALTVSGVEQGITGT